MVASSQWCAVLGPHDPTVTLAAPDRVWPFRSSSLQARIGGRSGFEKHTSSLLDRGAAGAAIADAPGLDPATLDRRAGRVIASAVTNREGPGR